MAVEGTEDWLCNGDLFLDGPQPTFRFGSATPGSLLKLVEDLASNDSATSPSLRDDASQVGAGLLVVLDASPSSTKELQPCDTFGCMHPFPSAFLRLKDMAFSVSDDVDEWRFVPYFICFARRMSSAEIGTISWTRGR